ncbi:MAG: TetR/AcrR family transcriptional regulator [Nocardioides sp.]|nr:TetR/AcrR family transcriptional regulator [Nocardioides sp.]
MSTGPTRAEGPYDDEEGAHEMTDLAAPADATLIERAFVAAVDAVDLDRNADILDAALELFSRQGVARTTMDDVARRAGTSRITVYRRMESKEALVEQVVLREFRRYFDQFREDVGRASTAEDRVVVGFVSSLRAIRHHPLIAGLLASDGDLVGPSVLGHDGRTLAMVSHFLAAQLRREQAAGHVAEHVDVDLVAEMMVRMSASFLLTPSQRIDVEDEEQLARLARAFIVPMLSARVDGS